MQRYKPPIEEGPPRRRRGSTTAALTSKPLLVALLLAAVVGVSLYVTPSTSTVRSRRALRQQQRQLQAPASSTSAGDASLFVAATGSTAGEGGASTRATLVEGDASRQVIEDDDDDDDDVLNLQPGWQQQDAGGGLERTLSFDVCGGFAEQRVALLSGMVLAAELNRTMVLPLLLSSGGRPGGSKAVDFGELYERSTFVGSMQATGLSIAEQPPRLQDTVSLRLSEQFNLFHVLAAEHGSTQHLRLDCPAYWVPSDLMVKHERLVFAALGALQPVERLAGVVQGVHSVLESRGQGNGFNMLTLDAGDQWQQHCERWDRLTNGLSSDNCHNNTDTVGDAMEVHRISHDAPLLVAVAGASTSDDVVQKALENLSSHGFQVVLKEDVLREVPEASALHREEAALVDYYVALRCRQYIGNSVSTFSAMAIMERWRADKYATYYNGGNIPLEAFLPLFPMPWVFTYNDWSSGTEYDHMVKGAVTSAIKAARMKPFCMFSGSEDSAMYRWLVSNGVRIIRHDPVWKDKLAKEGRRHRDLYTRIVSHLYKTDGSIVGAFQRIDIPILHEFDQYNYVLFTDCDVFFRKQMKLVDWGVPLPLAIGMGYERYDLFPYNDGVMLWNMPYMVKTNKAFTEWLLSNKNGMYFAGYGPVDQGAFNQYYEKEVRGKPISKDFNAMVYHTFRPNAKIVHLHGPKPNHYAEYMQTTKCQFKDMCEVGIGGGVCNYFAEYRQFVPEWEDVQTVARLCADLRAGVWHP